MECGRRADHDPGMFGRRKSVCALQRILSAGLVYKKDRIQPETNAGTSHDLVLSRDRLQAGWPKDGMTYGEESVLKKRGKVRRIL